jgi:hypothetical protein
VFDSKEVYFTPLEGSRCMVHIRRKWITSSPEKAIEVAYTDETLRAYTRKKLGIDEATAELLEDKHFIHVRSTHDWHRIVRELKRLFSWLPVGHSWRHHGAENDLAHAVVNQMRHSFTSYNANPRNLLS